MNNWINGIQEAIEYIEANLTQNIKVKDVAEKAYVSEFHFQRIFSALCGISIAEYIRNRRMSLAAKELVTKDVKVLDVALKYGYDSPDSFTRAFTKLHGITPSQAKESGVKLKDYAPVRIKLSLEGGTIMEFKIEEKASFTVMGRKRAFDTETSYQEIPKFWEEHFKDGGEKVVCGTYGLCIDSDGRFFDYLIADNYIPWKEIPEGYETRTLPAGLWAVFPCKQKTLQDTNTRMWREWLPNCKEYKLGGNYNIELYGPPCQEDIGESYVELWLPIENA
ncbi:MAG: helix-turn-helix domain-containing protein [Lachnospiraceae bacterium]|nr:helix-turn-helix domain-containing protein [Lachnospiraceae bacterium]